MCPTALLIANLPRSGPRHANRKTNSRGTTYGLSQHTYTAEQRIEEAGVVRGKSRGSEPFFATLTLEDGRIREKAHLTLMLPPLLRMF